MIWIISLNSSLGHIYSYEPKEHQLTLLESLTNPSAHLKDSDLLTDKPGHYQTMHAAKGAYEAPSDPHEVALARFTRNLADLLKKGLDNHQYKKLILCAPPHVGGALLSNLDKQVEHTLLINIKKNFVESDPSQLIDYLKANWWDIVRSNKL
ncbi:protein required for attachment to host cells [Candidatus Rickettsiella viridis]|uniref:Protein required for attachment to host cells n=1 Tax=Candidatus Rickettsiella viridis TaxID=676208 RepID=A0A2Z5UT24_9COXI|nr:host attachment protein [Candidatus Rickettsiella viridis]BBB14588.1 protein required for attachment to host cells [Candidatus Rickettsiella viridis]